MSEIRARIESLRGVMREEGISAYFIPTADFHGSEYVSDYFKVREFFSGFTGSAGSLLVTLEDALLWTDGRYFLQAEEELKDTGIKLMKMGEEGVKDVYQYIDENMPPRGVLGFDGRTVTVNEGKKLKKSAKKISYKKDLTKDIFKRPPFPKGGITNLPDELTGMSAADKLGRIREELKRKGADGIFISRLDDIAYILNIRGEDIPYNPVALAWLYITEDKARIFIGDGKADIAYPGILERPYEDITDFLKKGGAAGRVLVDFDSVNYLHYRLIKKNAGVIDEKSPSVMMKAVKNETEIRHLKEIFLKDSAALTRFIKFMTETEEELTETEAAKKLLAFRKETGEFKGPSFETISAFGKNAAVIHYEPSEERKVVIEKKGLYMVDSGGQYEGGTTDVTRTLVMGELSDEEREAFTLVAAGMLNVCSAVFLKGTTGHQLDILARQKLWSRGMDYKHGTGHGVGYMLNVHEGPVSIRSRADKRDCPLEPGMIVSDEPGVYRAGKFGVRTENILLVTEALKTEDGTFYRFENLTAVPIDHRGMDLNLLDEREKKIYMEYQEDVCKKLDSFLSEEEKSWLRDYTGLSENEKEMGN